MVSYSVAQRTHEIGIRLALGASARRKILWSVVAETGATVLAGVVLGTAAACAVTRLLASMLFGVTATDVPSFASVAVLLAAVALAASYIPARRAMRIDPIIALRHE